MDSMSDLASRASTLAVRPPATTRDRLLTPEEVAEVTGLSAETLAQWRSQRRNIPFLKISRNCVRYRQQDLDRWLQSRLIITPDEDTSLRR